jgi:phage/plasmid-like protein (TIGR03299 family)
MAANIEFNLERGTNSFASRKEIPWHKLGVVVDKPMSTAEAIKLCNADFTVKVGETYVKFNEEDWKADDNGILKCGDKVSDTFATYRTDNLHVFGSVGARYEVVQNIDAFEFIDGIVDTGEAVIETAGVLGHGERVFVSAKLPDYITLSNNDVIEGYLFITTSHDGSKMITAALTKIRVVCNNTLDAALRNCTNKVQFRHTKNVKDKLEQGRKLMHLNNKFSKEFENLLLSLKAQPVIDSAVKELVHKLFLNDEELALANSANGNLWRVDEISTRKKNIVRDVVYSIEGGPGQELYRGTGLWLYNGITTYLNNTRSYSSPEDKLIALSEGSESKIRQNALNLITELSMA